METSACSLFGTTNLGERTRLWFFIRYDSANISETNVSNPAKRRNDESGRPCHRRTWQDMAIQARTFGETSAPAGLVSGVRQSQTTENKSWRKRVRVELTRASKANS